MTQHTQLPRIALDADHVGAAAGNMVSSAITHTEATVGKRG
ncbi:MULTISPECIES: hypothetical protein [Streptomyces]|uniref:Uncharacterized protein n=1 Tax=Streptomyces rapamycinicus TaxID=1226757 RepID=A0ABR6LB47_9ACTN|nr:MULTISPECIES: hypothetical protein [Streptomyces]MBB4779560.1 hypothetical protein [Streptomyces rapamycinicus]